MNISVLIPAFNEAQNIKQTIDGLIRLKDEFLNKNGMDLQIIVIDDGSSDNTYERAVECGVEVLKLDRNIGKGGALNRGMKKARGDIVIFLDADLRGSSFEAYKLIIPIIQDSAAVTVAQFRPPKAKGGFGFVKALASHGVRFFTGHKLTSVLSGQRAFKRKVLEDIADIPDGYSLEVGMLIDILIKGYRVVEVDVDMYHDVTGRNLQGFLHRGKQFIHILRVLIRKIRERRAIA